MEIKNRISGIIFRLALLGSIWWILTEGEVSSWVMGVPAVILGALSTEWIPRVYSFRPRLLGALSFLFFFVVQSLKGGFDVAWRAVHPKRPLAPDFIRYDYRLSSELAVVLFTNTISLLPGTLSVELREGYVIVHALNARHPIPQRLQQLELNVADLFGEKL